jgi:ATP-binding cassette subfamily C (CFTR/MRP) protein 4
VEKEEGRKRTLAAQNDTILESYSESPEGLIATLLAYAGVKYDQNIDICIFSGIILLTILIALSRSFLFVSITMRASRNLHNAMLDGVSRASMYFFNTNSSGRILNRFSKDMGQVDEMLPAILIEVIQIFLLFFGITVVISIANPWNVIPAIIIFLLFYFMKNFYLGTSLVLKRMVRIYLGLLGWVEF